MSVRGDFTKAVLTEDILDQMEVLGKCISRLPMVLISVRPNNNNLEAVLGFNSADGKNFDLLVNATSKLGFKVSDVVDLHTGCKVTFKTSKTESKELRESCEYTTAVQAEADGYIVVRVEKSQSTTMPGYNVVEVLIPTTMGLEFAEDTARMKASLKGGSYVGEFVPYSHTKAEASERAKVWESESLKEDEAVMLCISASVLDFFGDSREPVAVFRGDTLESLGRTDGPISRHRVSFAGKMYHVETSPSSAWAILRPETV